jgi:hypothetical protein
MTTTKDSSNDLKPGEVRIDRLLGRRVLAANGRPVGRLEEFHAERRDGSWVITEYMMGAAGLLERFGLAAASLVGISRGGYVIRWDQLDLSHIDKPRLTCPVEDLEKR